MSYLYKRNAAKWLLLTALCWPMVADGQQSRLRHTYKVVSVTLPREKHSRKVLFFQVDRDSAGATLMAATGTKVAATVTTSPSIGLYEGTGVYQLTSDGLPTAAIVAQVGAKTLNVNLYQITPSGFRPIFQWSGWGFRVVQVEGRSGLALTSRAYWSLPSLFFWNGDNFVQCNECHPDFYEPDIARQREWMKGKNLPAYTYADACELGGTALTYAARYDEATKLCLKAVSAIDSPRTAPTKVPLDPPFPNPQSVESSKAWIEQVISRIALARAQHIRQLPNE